MSGILEGKRGIVFGALNDKSIAWRTALRLHAEGARMVLTNTAVSLRIGTIAELAEQCGAQVIPADATVVEDLENLVDRSMEILGGKIDFVLHSVGMSPNVRKGRPYTDLSYDFMAKTMDISAVSFHKLLQTLYRKDAMAEWGSIVALTYIASQSVVAGYGDMADAKAMLESIARNFGYEFARKSHVRINTVSQSPTMTTAGQGISGMTSMLDFADRMSPLGNATADDCAAYIATLFSDYTRKITMQTLYNDGGFSSMSLSPELMEVYLRGIEG